jgi:hypothetical protein
LHHKREGAFLGAKIGKMKTGIGKDDPYKLHPGEIQAFCYHLGSQEDIYLSISKLFEGILEHAFLPDSVRVYSADFEVGKSVPHLFFNELGAEPGVPDV